MGHRVAPLGIDRFGQTGNLDDLYDAYRLNGAAITEAAAEVLLANRLTQHLLGKAAAAA